MAVARKKGGPTIFIAENVISAGCENSLSVTTQLKFGTKNGDNNASDISVQRINKGKKMKITAKQLLKRTFFFFFQMKTSQMRKISVLRDIPTRLAPSQNHPMLNF